MSLEISWQDITLRLLLTIIGGGLIGINREERGQHAGLRTNLLVCLAASISMIQVNLLLGIAGKPSDSFVVLDLMRLPLGILSGMGFIGAGAILKKGNMVHGVTTAATLWFVTTMGLCFGGGQIILGLSALILGMLILGVLKHLEKHRNHLRHATLTIVAGQNTPSESEIINAITVKGYKVNSSCVTLGESASLLQMTCEISWLSSESKIDPFDFLRDLSKRFDLLRTDWQVER